MMDVTTLPHNDVIQYVKNAQDQHVFVPLVLTDHDSSIINASLSDASTLSFSQAIGLVYHVTYSIILSSIMEIVDVILDL